MNTQLLHTLFLLLGMSLGMPVLSHATDTSGDTRVQLANEDGVLITYLLTAEHEAEVTLSKSGDYSGSIRIPGSVTHDGAAYTVRSIAPEAFRDCIGITAVEFPNTLTTIGKSAFRGCSGLTSAKVPASVLEIGSYAFWSCSSLTSLTLEDGEETLLGAYAFYSCPVETLYLGRNTGKTLFSRTIRNLIVGAQVTEIGEQAFYQCTQLTNFQLPASLTSVGNSAFYGCEGLTAVRIPGSVTQIGRDAFRLCRNLSSLVLQDGVAPLEIDTLAFDFSPIKSLYLGRNTGRYSFPDYELASITLGNTVTEIGAYAFQYSKITAIDIPESVTAIGERAFYYCKGLTTVELPGSMTTIGECAFELCSGLTLVTIPNSVVHIGKNAFYGCGLLTIVNLPASMTRIPENMFSSSGLTEVKIPEAVTTIEAGAFQYCSDLASVELSPSLTTIGANAFQFCEELLAVEIPEHVTTIGAGAFYTCSNLATLVLPRAVTAIEPSAFEHSGLRQITVHWEIPLELDDPSVFNFRGNNYCQLVIPEGEASLAAYLASPTWQNFQISQTEGVVTPARSSLKVYADGLTLVVENAQGHPVRIVDSNGRVLAESPVAQETVFFPLPQPGLYIVSVGNERVKVLVPSSPVY